MNLFQTATPPKYSLSWALSVVETWQAKHTRVWQLLSQFPEMSSKTLAKLLVFRGKDWYYLKKWAYFIEKSWVLREKGLNSTTQLLSSTLKVFQKRTNATVFVHLTACLGQLTLEEPFERGASPGASAKGEALPSALV